MDGVPEVPVGWRERGLCWDTFDPRFFPERGESSKEIKGMCADCPVAFDCLEFSFDLNPRHGIWGGMSQRDRDRLKKEFNLEEEEAKTNPDTTSSDSSSRTGPQATAKVAAS